MDGPALQSTAGAAALTSFLLLAGCTTLPGRAGPPRFTAARGCEMAAQRPQSSADALRLCTTALSDTALQPPDRAATLVNRGIVHMHARNLAAAIADFDTVIRIHPETVEAYVNKGIALVNTGTRDAEAVAVLSEALERNPARPALVYYSRAIANEQLGRTRAAYEDYSRAVQLAPDWPEPAVQLQRFRVVRGKTASG